MGVYGLTQYVKQNMPNLGIRTNVLSLKTIVVDGNSFCFYIAKKINWLKGSQYHEFITLIKRHLEVFTNSQTELIFVFDGPLPDYKIEERHSRNQDKIEKLVLVIADAISNRNPDYHVQNLATSLLPPFAIPIAIHTMKELNFKCIVAEEEADLFIARLANSLNASVLSQDSDFFMFNIPSFILLDTLEFPTLMTSVDSDTIAVENSELESIVWGQLYTRKKFSSTIGIKQEHLFIFAVLGGSDHFTKQQIMELYKFNPSLGINIQRKNNKWPMVIKTVRSYGSMKPIQAIDAIVGKMRGDWGPRLKECLHLALDQYDNMLEVLSSKSNGVVIKLERELGQKQPKLYEIIGGKFFCVPFLENVKTGTSWNICRHLLDKTYSNLLPNAGVHEYYRSGMVMEVRHIDLSNESTPANEIEHLIQNEILKISSFECELDVIIVAFRYIILQRANINMALGNHDLCGWIAASVLLLKETIVNDSKEFIPSSADAIHQQAMIESTLYCMSLLWTVHTKGKDDISIFWKILHGPTLHKCQVRAKKGATPLQMVGKENLMDFYIMYKKVQSGLQSYIDTVMDYGSDFQLQATD